MTIEHIDISLNENDLNRLIERFVPPLGKISRLRAELQEGRLLVSGRANMFLNISFQLEFAVSHTATEIIARLESMNPASALANQFKSVVLEKIAEAASFIQHDKENDAIRIDIKNIFEKRVESAELEIAELTAAADTLTVKLQGEITF